MKDNRAKEALKNVKEEIARVNRMIAKEPENPIWKEQLPYLKIIRKYWENY